MNPAADIVLAAIKRLTAETGMATRQAIIETCPGLAQHVIKEYLDTLLDDGLIVRRERGVYQAVEQTAPPRPVSRTVVHGGCVTIEVGDDVLKLSPIEEAMLRSMYAAPGAAAPAAFSVSAPTAAEAVKILAAMVK